jgi:chitinase
VENQPPLAHAGSNRSVPTLAVVTLDGSLSSDPDGDLPLSYLWTQTSGLTVTLSDPTSVTPTFTAPPDPALLTFTLLVTDSLGLSSSPDQVTVIVREGGTYTYLPMVQK